MSFLVASVVALPLLAPAAGATPTSHASPVKHLSGVVVALTGSTLNFVQGGNPRGPVTTVHLTSATSITSHNATATTALLIPGARVAVSDDVATRMAISIRVSPPKLTHVSGTLLAHSASALRIETITGNPDSDVTVRLGATTRFSEHFLTSSVANLHVGQRVHVDVNAFTSIATLVRMTPPAALHHKGIVVAVTPSSVTVRLTSAPVGALLTLRLTPTTAYSEHSLTTAKSALTVGAKVNVTESLHEATLVRITPPKG